MARAAAQTAYKSEATAVAARKARSRDMRKSTDGAPSHVTPLCVGCERSPWRTSAWRQIRRSGC
jgi:hypothetical protein